MLGRTPKDFDIATNALPEQVHQLFRNCRVIGRRFRLAHIRFGREIVEVATYRGAHSDDDDHGLSTDGRVVRDNVFSSLLEEDAQRRDFTVNSLYYNVDEGSIIDYSGGVEHLKAGVLHLMGDPRVRYREDPVRMLRAVRFAAKLGFRIDTESEAPLFEFGELLEAIPAARLFEEVLKLFMSGHAVQSLQLLCHYRLFEHLFPQAGHATAQLASSSPLLLQALANTDARIAQDKPVTPAFLFAALLWGPLRHAIEQLQGQGASELQTMQLASEKVVARQVKRTALPKRFSVPMREIWALQASLRQRLGKRPVRLLTHPRFRAAYDFMLLRCSAGEDIQELCDWWTAFQSAEVGEQQAMIGRMKPPTDTRRRYSK